MWLTDLIERNFMSKKTYNVLKPPRIHQQRGNQEAFVEVGAAWDIESGGMSIELHEGIAVSGRFVILPRKDKAEAESAEE